MNGSALFQALAHIAYDPYMGKEKVDEMFNTVDVPCEVLTEQPFASNCCGAEASGEAMDMGMCPRCKDHCEFTKTDEQGNTIETYEV